MPNGFRYGGIEYSINPYGLEDPVCCRMLQDIVVVVLIWSLDPSGHVVWKIQLNTKIQLDTRHGHSSSRCRINPFTCILFSIHWCCRLCQSINQLLLAPTIWFVSSCWWCTSSRDDDDTSFRIDVLLSSPSTRWCSSTNTIFFLLLPRLVLVLDTLPLFPMVLWFNSLHCSCLHFVLHYENTLVVFTAQVGFSFL